MTMAERLTLKKLSGELETLRSRVLELEQQFEHKLRVTLEEAVTRLRSGSKSANLPEHGPSIDAEHRQRLIAEAAYLIAEQRGFQGGDPAQDWARAEQQVNEHLMQEGMTGEAALHARKSARKKAGTKPPGRLK
jgi:hypothetical protein